MEVYEIIFPKWLEEVIEEGQKRKQKEGKKMKKSLPIVHSENK